MPIPVTAMQHEYLYVFPTWAMMNSEQVQSSASLKRETALKAVEQVLRVASIKQTYPHMGQHVDQYV